MAMDWGMEFEIGEHMNPRDNILECKSEQIILKQYSRLLHEVQNREIGRELRT